MTRKIKRYFLFMILGIAGLFTGKAMADSYDDLKDYGFPKADRYDSCLNCGGGFKFAQDSGCYDVYCN